MSSTNFGKHCTHRIGREALTSQSECCCRNGVFILIFLPQSQHRVLIRFKLSRFKLSLPSRRFSFEFKASSPLASSPLSSSPLSFSAFLKRDLGNLVDFWRWEDGAIMGMVVVLVMAQDFWGPIEVESDVCCDVGCGGTVEGGGGERGWCRGCWRGWRGGFAFWTVVF